MKGKFSKKYSKIFSEIVRGMKLKLGMHAYDISLYIVCYCHCLTALVAVNIEFPQT